MDTFIQHRGKVVCLHQRVLAAEDETGQDRIHCRVPADDVALRHHPPETSSPCNRSVPVLEDSYCKQFFPNALTFAKRKTGHLMATGVFRECF